MPTPNDPPRVHCPTCKHYFVTYDPSLPHGCRLFGIRTRLLPNAVVRQETGQECTEYAAKPRPK